MLWLDIFGAYLKTAGAGSDYGFKDLQGGSLEDFSF